MNDNLHSLNKLQQDIKNAKFISLLLPKEQRKQLKQIENQLTHMTKAIELFNQYFTDAGWCAYDSMNLPLTERAIEAYQKDGIDAGERILVEYYKNDVRDIIHWIKNKSKSFMVRYDLIQKAFEDHFAGRYYASVPLFLIIIDGAVNDYTKSKGFFAEGTDVTAWDCLVGCSDGLSKLKSIFNKGRNKTNTDEIKLPYRNGILHGRDLNYGNEYVSCKCVALMFALADWMNMKDSEEERKEKFEKENNPPPLLESLNKVRQNAIDRDEINKWKKRDVVLGTDLPITPNIDDCNDYPYIIPLLKAFNAWNNRNYGDLSIYFRNLFSYEESTKKLAGECRKLFSSKEFISFELKEIEERGCSLTRILVQVDWKIGNKVYSEPLEFGCVYKGSNEKVALPWRNNGRWILMPWKIQGLYKM